MVNTTVMPTKECRNLLSATQQPHAVKELILSEVQKGFLAGPFSSPPFSTYRVSPIGIAEGKYTKKKRLIVDLSSPHNSKNHCSVNDLINKEQCTLSYVTIDDAIREIMKQGQGARMCKTDISDAFKIIPIMPSQYHLFCIKWEEDYYFYRTLSFGCRSSPKIFDALSSAICWIAQNKYGVRFILHLLDDFLTIDSPTYDAERTMAILSFLFNKIKVPLAAHKTEGPCTVLQYLGIILDSDKFEARLPVDKVERVSSLIDNFKDRKSCTKRELLQLLGHLNFAMRVIPPGRSFVSYLISLAASVPELHHHVHINAGCQEDLAMWALFLQRWNGVSLFRESQLTVAADIELYTDAASTKGFGGFYKGLWFSEAWPAGLPADDDVAVSMSFRELYPIVVAAILWGSRWHRKRILFHCDNLGTVHIIKKGRSKSKSVMMLMRKLTWCALINQFSVYAEHIPGKLIPIADALSRLQIDTFRRLAPAAALEPCPCPAMQEVLWNYTQMRSSSSSTR